MNKKCFNMINQFIGISFVILVLIGCGSTSSTNPDTNINTIEGRVVDGYIKGAIITVKNKSTGTIISLTTTTSNGSFSFEKPDVDIIVESTGGTDTSTNEPFIGVMKNIIAKNSLDTKIVITPLTSLVVQLIQNGEVEQIEEAKNIIATSMNIDIKTLDLDPIEMLKSGTSSEKLKAAKMMKNILTVQKLAETISSVSDDPDISYQNTFKTIAKKLVDTNLTLSEVIDTNNISSLIDDINVSTSLEREKFDAIKELVKNTIIILNNLGVDELKDASNIDAKIASNARAIEFLIIPLKVKLQDIQDANNTADINTTKIKALNVTKATIALGGIKGMARILSKEDNNIKISDFAKDYLTEDKISAQSAKYDRAKKDGKTIIEIIEANSGISRSDVLKFLRQSSFTSKESDITFIMHNGYESWIDTQFALPSDLEDADDKYGYLQSTLRFLNEVDSDNYPDTIFTDPFDNLKEIGDTDRFKVFRNHIWWTKALKNEDQLRQKVTYALSQILVTSYVSPAGGMLKFRGESLSYYYDILYKHAFGNYRNLLKDVTLSPTMGYYLTYIGNKKTDTTKGTAPDENYARELMQLFTIGLKELNIDGTAKMPNGMFMPTYTQDDVVELSKVFTGWDLQDSTSDGKKETRYGNTGQNNNSHIVPLEFTAKYHEDGAKTVLGQTISAGLSGEEDIDRALDILFSNQNVAPYISKHLIMRLVTSNPSPAYVGRVALVFNDNGSGIKGDLKAVVKAILLDDEARGVNIPSNFGKVDEMVNVFARFLDVFNAKSVEGWEFNKNGKTTMVDKLYFNSEIAFRQSPLSAESVFNFYSPDFVPSDSSFANSNTLSPELEIQTSLSIIGFSNTIASFLSKEKTDGTGKGQVHNSLMYVDLQKEFDIFEQALDGDTNGDFANFDNSDKKELAVKVLIMHLDELLLGTTMPIDFKNKLIAHLVTIKKNNNFESGTKFIIHEAIRSIITSPLYMVMK
jgi:uncharacterized protein (DUF1800 family)